MKKDYIAKAKITINAPIVKVWDALINPELIKKYMFGTNVVSDWKEDKTIVWKGEWEGKKYEDKGKILKLVPKHLIQYNHFSPLSGLSDAPENYHIVTIKLSDKGSRTFLSLSQSNNPSKQAREHSEKNWGMILTNLKQLLEDEVDPKLFVDKSIIINAPASKVWDTLTKREYTDLWVHEFSSGGPQFHIESDWKLGSNVLWKDQDGTVIVDGNVTALKLYKLIRFTVFDVRSPEKPLITEEDGITYQLSVENSKTILRIRQGDFSVMSEGKKYRDLSAEVWDRVLPKVKELAEKKGENNNTISDY